MFDLYVITPDRPAHEIWTCAQRLFANATSPPTVEGPPRSAGAAPLTNARVGLQLRSKQLDRGERRTLARDLRALTRAHGASLILNGDIELAREIGADGVQLPERAISVSEARAELGAGALIGASRHGLHDVLRAGRDGASFVTLSPLFDVPDKGEPLGLSVLTEVAARSAIPVFALGGIDAARASAAVRAGAHGVAVIRQVWDSADPAGAARALLHAIDAGRAPAPG